MPIKPENRARYPKNWKEIRAQILERAQHKCEFCGIENYKYRWTDRGVEHVGSEEDYCDFYNRSDGEMWPKATRIVLTIAHLDHTPENNAPENLRALCQRCHLRYDKPHHMRNAAITRHNRRNGGASLFQLEGV